MHTQEPRAASFPSIQQGAPETVAQDLDAKNINCAKAEKAAGFGQAETAGSDATPAVSCDIPSGPLPAADASASDLSKTIEEQNRRIRGIDEPSPAKSVADSPEIVDKYRKKKRLHGKKPLLGPPLTREQLLLAARYDDLLAARTAFLGSLSEVAAGWFARVRRSLREKAPSTVGEKNEFVETLNDELDRLGLVVLPTSGQPSCFSVSPVGDFEVCSLRDRSVIFSRSDVDEFFSAFESGQALRLAAPRAMHVTSAVRMDQAHRGGIETVENPSGAAETVADTPAPTFTAPLPHEETVVSLIAPDIAPESPMRWQDVELCRRLEVRYGERGAILAAIKRRIQQMPQRTLEDYRAIATWINDQAELFGLSVKCPARNCPSTLSATTAGDEKPRFSFRVNNKRGPSAADVNALTEILDLVPIVPGKSRHKSGFSEKS